MLHARSAGSISLVVDTREASAAELTRWLAAAVDPWSVGTSRDHCFCCGNTGTSHRRTDWYHRALSPEFTMLRCLHPPPLTVQILRCRVTSVVRCSCTGGGAHVRECRGARGHSCARCCTAMRCCSVLHRGGRVSR